MTAANPTPPVQAPVAASPAMTVQLAAKPRIAPCLAEALLSIFIILILALGVLAALGTFAFAAMENEPMFALIGVGILLGVVLFLFPYIALRSILRYLRITATAHQQ